MASSRRAQSRKRPRKARAEVRKGGGAAVKGRGKRRAKSKEVVASPGALDGGGVSQTRQLFWHNVVREMLTGLSVLAQSKPEFFDGRFAVLTTAGERVPIGEVYPLFACSIPGTAWEREASVAVQCTVFRITTPDGEVYTMPVHEIRAMHALTPELMEQLAEAEGEAGDETDEETRPFGLAAFSALPKAPPADAPSEAAI